MARQDRRGGEPTAKGLGRSLSWWPFQSVAAAGRPLGLSRRRAAAAVWGLVTISVIWATSGCDGSSMDDAGLIAKMRDPAYFGITENEALNSELRDFLADKPNRYVTEAVVKQIAFGRTVPPAVDSRTDTLAEITFLNFLKKGADVAWSSALQELLRRIGSYTQTDLAGLVPLLATLKTIIAGVDIFFKFADAITIRDRETLVFDYVQSRKGGEPLDNSENAFRDLLDVYTVKIDQIEKLMQLRSLRGETDVRRAFRDYLEYSYQSWKVANDPQAKDSVKRYVLRWITRKTVPSAPTTGLIQVQATKVEDGDTFCVRGAEAPPGTRAGICASETRDIHDDWPVRLIGVDTPELEPTVQCYAQEAKAMLRDLMEGKTVWLELDPARILDKDFRVLAYVWVQTAPGGRLEMVNEKIVRDGWGREAHWFPPPNGEVKTTKYRERLREGEAEAKSAGRGIWGACQLFCVPSTGSVEPGSYAPAHKALDIVAQKGDDPTVYAAADGVIRYVYRWDTPGRDPWHGVIIEHRGGFRTVYLHMGKNGDPDRSYISPWILTALPDDVRHPTSTAGSAAVNIPVRRGDILGRQGDAGRYRGQSPLVHLHFQVQLNPATWSWRDDEESAIDPRNGYLDSPARLNPASGRLAETCSSQATEGTALVFVVDISNSMREPSGAGSKIEGVVRAVKDVLELVRLDQRLAPGAHQLAMVTFSDSGRTRVALTGHVDAIREGADELRPSGNTNLGAGLALAIESVNAHRRGSRAILLLTDGMTNRGLAKERILAGPAAEAAANGICLHVVGFGAGDQIDRAFLERLGSATSCGGFLQTTQLIDVFQKYLTLRHEQTGLALLSRTGTVRPGESVVVGSAQVPAGQGFLVATLAWPGSSLGLEVKDPYGAAVSPGYPGAAFAEDAGLLHLAVRDPPSGTWAFSVLGQDVPRAGTPYTLVASVRPAAEPASPRILASLVVMLAAALVAALLLRGLLSRGRAPTVRACPRCGQALSLQFDFCTSCGAALADR